LPTQMNANANATVNANANGDDVDCEYSTGLGASEGFNNVAHV